VRALEPDQTVDEAVAFARRYGHEGYPVVEDGKLLGVLTRRDLDRALHHHMASVPLSRLLSGQSPTVSPDDSVETLQQVMMEHDVGQVPVVEHGQIIGIATRTDLLELWSERLAAGSRRRRHVADVGEALVKALTPTQMDAIRAIAEVAAERSERAYLVGGLVRDLVLGREPGPDIDVVIAGDATTLAAELAQKHGGRVTAHRRFGTAKWIIGEDEIDLSSARSEYYREPTALPSVVRGSLRSDLRRRDFTINTLALDLDAARFGRIIDPYHGVADAKAGLIRVLHSLSFVEDPTRILRAVRFEVRLGFAMDPRTAELAADAAPLLERVSGARIRNELLQLFREPDPVAALRRLEALGALEAVHPALGAGGERLAALLSSLGPAWESWLEEATGIGLEPGPRPQHALALWLAEHGQAGIDAAHRLHLTRRQSDLVAAVVQLVASDGPAGAADSRPSQVYRALCGQRPEALLLAWLATTNDSLRHNIHVYVTELAQTRTLLGGHDLERLGLEPGPIYGDVLDAVLNARLDGIVETRQDELSLATRLISEATEHSEA
jgi:tRNA nucleotidyltransferase (CCA-adding enzyme)